MPGQNCDVLDTLGIELEFLELGLCRAPTPGRPLLIFQDSPCPRYGAAICPNCDLMQFVPSEFRREAVPCHYIRLNDDSETVDSLYQTGTQEELEEALRNWLTTTIQSLEESQIPAKEIPALGDPLEARRLAS